MGKLSMAVTVAFLAVNVGMAGLVWGQQTGGPIIGISGGKPNPETAGKSSDAGENLTLHDQSQISGNLSGTGAGSGKTLSKHLTKETVTKGAYFLKYNKNTNSYDKWTKFNGKTVPFTGGTKIQNGYDKQLMPGGGAGNGFVKSNSLSKTGLSGNNQLPAVQK